MNTIVRSPDQPNATHFQTSELRYSVMIKGRLINDDFRDGLALRILNISEGGIMAAIPYGVRVYSEVMIELRNIPPVSGRIAWCRKDRIGVAFDEKIDLDLFFGRQDAQKGMAQNSSAMNQPLIRKLNS
ncbi:PilZ domain-containing protein [Rhizorhapis sp. SPR117]|uniref:PilZ domain-containing protein n=1 Tax=Rhizorhapis sp. SPR117 TaxID=2912611 RepID=UPI001F3E3D09|nr:PilZ domain-containing protein [Rhizorhapis sp. SPR117]